MDKNTKIGILCLLCLTATFLLSGCVHQATHPPSASPEFSITDVETRAKELEDSRFHESTSEMDRRMASSLLSAYTSIRAVLDSGALSTQSLVELESIFKNLAEIESLYFLERKEEEVSPKEAMRHFTATQKQIFEDYLFGDYQRVIDRCIALEADYGQAALSTDVGLLFALSLGKRGYYEQALQVGKALVSRLQGRPDLIALQIQILAWHLELDQKEEAIATLDSLIDSMGEQQAQFREAQMMLSMDGEKTISKAHGSEHAVLPQLESKVGIPGSIEAVLQEVDHLVSAHQFTEARDLLISYRAQMLEGPEMDRIDQAIQAVALSEERYYRENYEKMQQRQAVLEEAKRLIDEERYETALAMIDDLQSEGEMTPEAEGLKALATEKHINVERSEAAKMFLLARSANDLEKKRELLNSSRQILTRLIEKYPSSPLIDRVISHLKKVDDELEKLDGNDG